MIFITCQFMITLLTVFEHLLSRWKWISDCKWYKTACSIRLSEIKHDESSSMELILLSRWKCASYYILMFDEMQIAAVRGLLLKMKTGITWRIYRDWCHWYCTMGSKHEIKVLKSVSRRIRIEMLKNLTTRIFCRKYIWETDVYTGFGQSFRCLFQRMKVSRSKFEQTKNHGDFLFYLFIKKHWNGLSRWIIKIWLIPNINIKFITVWKTLAASGG